MVEAGIPHKIWVGRLFLWLNTKDSLKNADKRQHGTPFTGFEQFEGE